MQVSEISFNEACDFYKKISFKHQVPSLNPVYIYCDSFRSKKLKPVFWLAKKEKKFLLHSFYIYKNKELDINDIECSYGYGGPLGNNLDEIFIKEVGEKFSKWCIKKNIIAEFLRLHPLIDHKKFYWGKIIHNRKTAIIDLKSNFFSFYKSGRKTDLKTAYKHKYELKKVSCKIMLENFPNIYYDNMKYINAKKFYFFDLKYFKNLSSSNIVDNWLVYRNNQVISGAIILKNNQSRMLEYHLSSRKDFKDKSSVYLIHNLCEYYKNKRYEIFYLGGGRSTKDNDTLLNFKKGFTPKECDFNIGFEIYDKDKYYYLKQNFKGDTSNILFYR